MMEHTDVGMHGMVVVGTQTVYASHLPMFMSPHDYRVVIEVSFDRAAYHDARRHFGTSALFTLAPEPFSIHELEPAADGRPARREFRAELFFGHFERGGDSLGEVVVKVERTLVFRHLDPAKKAPELGYVLFGRGPDLFLAHEITAAPDFDQLLAVQLGVGGTEPASGQAWKLNIPGRRNSLEHRLLPGEQVGAAVTSDAVTATCSPPPPPATVDLQMLAEVYLETSDLAA
jgi:hypothetical protein